MSKLLDFLRHSFGGGTDVDRPLELSLQRLESQGWEQVRQGFREPGGWPAVCWSSACACTIACCCSLCPCALLIHHRYVLQADILMVTDGEISPLNEDIKQRLKYAHEERGLEVRTDMSI